MIKRWLAFDIGTSGAKAAVLDEHGLVIQSCTQSCATATGDNAAEWWQAVIDATRELNPKGVEGIALTGQMQDVILLDEAHQPVRPVILYNDTRFTAEIETIRSQIGDDVLRQITGNDQDASSLLAKLLWLELHEPDNLRQSKHLLFGAADYVALQMTDRAASDATTAATTGLLDLQTRQVIEQSILAQIGLGHVHGLLPEIVLGGSTVGTLTQEAARLLNLPVGIPVHLGPGDAGAATLGVGSGEPGHPYVYIGTSGWVGLTRDTLADPETGAFNLAHPRSDRTFCLAPLLTAGGNLDWAAEIFGDVDHDTLIERGLAQPPDDLLYLPYLNGERSPFRDPHARGAFIGLNAHHTRNHLYRAVLEGVVFAYRHCLEALAPAGIQSIIVTGGGARSTAWCQLFADVLNLPVLIAGDAEFVGVRGVVLAAQVARGERESFMPDGYFPVSEMLKPSEDSHYDAQYIRFRNAYPALKPLFQK